MSANEQFAALVVHSWLVMSVELYQWGVSFPATMQFKHRSSREIDQSIARYGVLGSVEVSDNRSIPRSYFAV